ncbi:TIGR02450 family Trp-rich protein [Polynucleobacter sp. AP-Nino-20-G2]|uniref:TIGR02450 family Trp-rich protein n=1 Tax=Polynucleobacter sp. AP-Nino-20-G2 TaxID=2576917 RepID=UPI0020409DC5|nr:TIGR02450 family Trp-rich protein [Polynucleobacter sp. AP-Nino-20-G2]
MPSKKINPLSPKKLLLTKWTAAHPKNKRKHFLVSKVIAPDLPDEAIELVEIEAIYDKYRQTIAWRELCDSEHWIQGWV